MSGLKLGTPALFGVEHYLGKRLLVGDRAFFESFTGLALCISQENDA